MKKFITYILAHKFITAFTIAIIIGGSYFGFKTLAAEKTETKYFLSAVQKGTLITTITGSGQISASNQIDIKTKASGDVTSFNVIKGQEIKAGSKIATLNAKDVLKTIRDAEANLASAKLSMEKAMQPADSLSILQAENSLIQSQENKQKAEDELKKAYEDGYNNIANAYLELPNIMSSLDDMLYGNDFDYSIDNVDYYAMDAGILDNADRAKNFKDSVTQSYELARVAYVNNFDNYKASSRFSDNSIIESLIDESYNTVKLIAETIKNTNNLIQYYYDVLSSKNMRVQPLATTHLSSLSSFTGKTNSQLLTILSTKRSIQTNKESILSSDRTIAEKTASLAKLKADIDPLDYESQQLAIRQRQNALNDAREKLADYTVRAPFDGVIAATSIKKNDSISSGTTVATIITKQKLAKISFNEIDIAAIQIGQKATLTFDAIMDLDLTGEVVEIDTLGTVNQGVVTYDATIMFDTQDERIKPGMSITVSIITNAKTDILLIPNGAVKTFGSTYYVEMFDKETIALSGYNTSTASTGISFTTLPNQYPIEVGLSNDSYTEVISGLAEGDLIVSKTTSNSTQKQTTVQGQSLFPVGSTPTGGNAGMRMTR
jgi:HlyD family secretion protein